MKIYDLRCAHDHRFEGWFASSEAYESQLAGGYVSCPVCADTKVTRLPSAPYLNFSARPQKTDASEAPAAERAPASDAVPLGSQRQPAQVEQMQAQWLKMVSEIVQKTENVGDAFTEEARRIHYREAPERAIRGVASADQVAELADEGIDVLALPVPASAKGSLQ